MTSGTTIFDTTIQAYTGSTGAPSITFGTTDTGLYGNSNSIGFSITASEKINIGTTIDTSTPIVSDKSGLDDTTNLQGQYRFIRDISGKSNRNLVVVNEVTEVLELTDGVGVTRYYNSLFDNSTNPSTLNTTNTNLATAIRNTDITINFNINTTNSNVAIMTITDTINSYLDIGITVSGAIRVKLTDNAGAEVLNFATLGGIYNINTGNWVSVSIVLGSSGNSILINNIAPPLSYTAGSDADPDTIPSDVTDVILGGQEDTLFANTFNGYLNNVMFISEELNFVERQVIREDTGIQSQRIRTDALHLSGILLNNGGIPCIFRYHDTTTQSISGETILQTDETKYDVGGISYSGDVYTLPNQGGVYLCSSQCTFGPNASGTRSVFFKDSDGVSWGKHSDGNLSGASGVRVFVSVAVYYDGAGTFTLTPYAAAYGTTVSLATVSGAEPVFVSITKIG
jgi:hypothetical protein